MLARRVCVMEKHRKLAIEFQEEYKRLDRLCKDMFQSANGVTEYIEQMKNVDPLSATLRDLKHVRWVRNQLAHEVGALESGVCEKEDLLFVKRFYTQILNGTDPLTLWRVEQEKKTRKSNKEKKKPSLLRRLLRLFFWG